MAVADRIGQALVVFPEFPETAPRLAAEFGSISFHSHPDFDAASEILPTTELLVTSGVGLEVRHVAKMPRLRWILCATSGTDHFIGAVRGRDEVLVTNARGVHAPQMAEMALFHMLSLGRGANQLQRNRDARRWERIDQKLLRGRRVVIVGIGAIGEEIAAVAHALGMSVTGISRTPREVPGIDRMISPRDLLGAAAEADFVVSVAPGEQGSAPIFGAEFFAAMRPTAFFINLGRGSTVDEKALIDCLRQGAIAGAGLDVFATEPLPEDSPLWDLPQVTLTPHLGGQNDRYLDQFLPLAIENIGHFQTGNLDRIQNVVAGDPGIG